MKKAIVLLAVTAVVFGLSHGIMAGSMTGSAFNKDSFARVLEQYSCIMAQINVLLQKQGVAPKPNAPSDSDEIWLKADDINMRLERMINGINTVKGVYAALTVINNLYKGGQISADAAFAMITTLKQRAIFIKLHISNGSDELDILLNVLTDRENEFISKLSPSSR